MKSYIINGQTSHIWDFAIIYRSYFIANGKAGWVLSQNTNYMHCQYRSDCAYILNFQDEREEMAVASPYRHSKRGPTRHLGKRCLKHGDVYKSNSRQKV